MIYTKDTSNCLTHCVVDSSELNEEEAVLLVHELKLQESLHMICMYRNGDPKLAYSVIEYLASQRLISADSD